MARGVSGRTEHNAPCCLSQSVRHAIDARSRLRPHFPFSRHVAPTKEPTKELTEDEHEAIFAAGNRRKRYVRMPVVDGPHALRILSLRKKPAGADFHESESKIGRSRARLMPRQSRCTAVRMLLITYQRGHCSARAVNAHMPPSFLDWAAILTFACMPRAVRIPFSQSTTQAFSWVGDSLPR